MLRAVLNPGSNKLQISSCTNTYLPSHKPSQFDEQDILGTDHSWRFIRILLCILKLNYS